MIQDFNWLYRYPLWLSQHRAGYNWQQFGHSRINSLGDIMPEEGHMALISNSQSTESTLRFWNGKFFLITIFKGSSLVIFTHSIVCTSSSAIAETALQGGLVMAKSARLELRDNIYGQYRSLFNHCDVFGQQRNQNRRKKRKMRAVTPFKVIQGHTRSSRSVPIESRMRLFISD